MTFFLFSFILSAIIAYADDSTTSAAAPDSDIAAKIYEANLSTSTTSTTTSKDITTIPTAQVSVQNNNKFYTISEFIIPNGFQLHIKIWKDGKETEEYYEYTSDVGINYKGNTERYPIVDALCCIKYGNEGNLKPFSIDLNQRGKGLTDLPGCEVKDADSPTGSLIVNLPTKAPDTNL